MEDKELKDIFATYRPRLSSAEDFTSQLQRRIEAVERVREYVECRHRRYRKLLVAAFAFGLVVGIGVVIYLATNPVIVSRMMNILSWEWGSIPDISVIELLPVAVLAFVASVVVLLPLVSRR